MKVVILAGGYGTRLSEFTSLIPKPMVQIGNKPILEHIMIGYSKFGFKDFYLALGYKGNVIKDYFYKYQIINSDFQVDLSDGSIKPYYRHAPDWKISLIDTGIDSMTGGRLLRLKEFISEDTFLMTYGDAVSNVDIEKLLDFHKSHGKLVTVTAVRPPARFGEMEINNNEVVSFLEKPQIREGWINGGFFAIEPEFLDYLDNDQTVLEKKPLETAANNDQLMAYFHEDFWQCMDTKRDKDLLEKMIINKNTPWLN